MNLGKGCLTYVLHYFSICLDLDLISPAIPDTQSVKDGKAGTVDAVRLEDFAIGIKLVNFATNSRESDRLSLDDFDDDLIRQNSLHLSVANPGKFFDTRAYLVEADLEYVRT